MNRGWIFSKNKLSQEYKDGIESFIDVAKHHLDHNDETLCPCVKCQVFEPHPLSVIRYHLAKYGMSVTYVKWTEHGEKQTPEMDVSQKKRGPNDSVFDILNDFFPKKNRMDQYYREDEMDEDLEGEDGSLKTGPEHVEVGDGYVRKHNEVGDGSIEHVEVGDSSNQHNAEAEKFKKLIAEAEREFFPGCQLSVLTAMVKLMHSKVLNRWTNKSFDMLLEFMKLCCPKPNNIPSSFYEANKMLKDLGLGYEKIHVCRNDCVLFYKEHANKEICPVCKEPRYKPTADLDAENEQERKKIPYKVLRYFPLKPRLQRLFMSMHTATNMRWHRDKRKDVAGTMSHPVDSIAWKEFDKMYPEFAAEPRNVRLGLATDGFNPFGNRSLSYSMWPVTVVAYNLPPWWCMKSQFTMMTLLIPGPNAPGNDIDVYLRPLIEELKDLWDNGVETYDRSTNSSFKLKAAVLWTINDFPAYANLSGWSTKGYLACPTCNRETKSQPLRDKIGYIGHRTLLRMNHPWRKRPELFNNKVETRKPPKELSGDDILLQLAKVRPCTHGKHKDNPDNKRKRLPAELNWTKKSIFFELEYWSKLKIRHNLDVMHIEKNICDAVVGTLLGLDKISKDTVKARLDLQDMGIRESLHLEKHGEKFKKHLAYYTVSPQQRLQFFKWMSTATFPDGYVSNLSRNVKNGKLTGLKTHDCHVLLQRLLPIGIRPFLPKNVCDPIIELASFFEQLCAKTLKVADLDRLQRDIVVILCKLEQIFLPAFFGIMIHLAVHLPQEAKIAGPVGYRWMFPIERKLGNLKDYVRNRARPEGSIAEGYIAEESLTFCSMYLNDMETVFTRPERNDDGGETNAMLSVFAQNVRPLGGYKMVDWSDKDMEPAYWYILDNCDEVEPFKTQHYEILKSESLLNLEDRHREQFPSWFQTHITNLYNQRSSEVTEELYALAFGPHNTVGTYTSCNVNGIRWHVKQLEQTRTVQNSGIMVPGSHDDRESDFYGQLVSIVKLDFPFGNSVFLFKGEWFNTTNTKKRRRTIRDYHLTSLNVKDKWHVKDPFVLVKQAQQVFYLDDPKLGDGWKVIQHIRHRHIWDVPENEQSHDAESSYVDGMYQEEESRHPIEEHANPIQLCRRDVNPEIVVLSRKDLEKSNISDHDFIDDTPPDEELSSDDEEETGENDVDSDLEFD